MGQLTARARKVFCLAAIILFTLSVLPCWLFVLFRWRRYVEYSARIWGRVIIWLIQMIGAISAISRIDAEAQMLLDDQTPVILAARHQSIWETLYLWNRFAPIFVIKHELLAVPVVGSFMRYLGMIAIRREVGGAGLRTMIRAARHVTESGRCIAIFPEGTRVEVGKYQKLQPGIYALYRELALPIIPIYHDSGCFWRGTGIYPGRITVIVGPPILPGLERAEMMQRLRQSMLSPESHGNEQQG